MKTDNRTDYDTREIRAVLCAWHSSRAKRLPQWERLTVRIGYARAGNRSYTGHAYLRGRFTHLSVPRGGLAVVELLALWDHELAHLYGVQHEDMGPAQLHCQVTEPMRVMARLWPETLTERVAVQPSAQEIATEKVATQADRLLARRKAWVTRFRRAETALAKIDRALARIARKGVVEIPALPKAANRRRK